jgi:thiamine kinase-like enzyme
MSGGGSGAAGEGWADLADVVARMPEWQGRELEATVLKGGLSHLTYRVGIDGRPFVVRILNRDIDRFLLGIPPEEEIENTVRAAETGVGARVLAAFPDLPAMVLEHIEGVTLSLELVRNPANIPRIGRACRILHERARPFVNRFDIFRQLDGFLEICRRHGLRIPDGYEGYLPTIARIEAALAERAEKPVACHNDLLAENLMDDGRDVRIIDYQLSGMHDRCFELGDVAAESDFTPDDVELLCESYFGGRLPGQVARTRLYLIMSNFTWTLWFSVHKGLIDPHPDVDFDYWEEALDKWSQAVRDLEAEDFGRVLARARTPD